VYEEEEALPYFHRVLVEVLDGLASEYDIEIVYVDDGSRDGTLPLLRRMTREDPRVRYHSLSRNFGHQAALTAGLERARGDAVISMDSDLQHPPRVLPQLLEKWRQGHEIVITIRGDDQRLSRFKRLSSKAFYRAMSLLSDTEIRLAASDFRLLSRKAVQGLLQMREQHRFVRGMVQWLGFQPAEIVFTPDERKAGQSKYTLGRMLRLAGDGLFSFSRVPLRLATYLGLVVAAMGVGQSCWFVIQNLRGAESLPLTMQYLSVVTQLLGGGILCALGCLGEYVGRIHEQVKGRPVYVLKDQSPLPSTAISRQRDAA
jgi:dolichol-phosphate mannosyltransferase